MALLILGILLFFATALDIVKTTLSARGGGLLTNAVSRGVWACFFAAAGGQGRSKLLPYAGQCVLMCVLVTWIACLWASLWLMLVSHDGAVVDDATGRAANLWETLYYAGFTLSTLGVGDYTAAGDGWRALTSIAAFCGLAFITLAITYIMPVLSAVKLQHQLALFVRSMGATPQQILVNSWNGSDFSRFYGRVDDLRQMLVAHTLNHHAYPVIRCFHDSDAGRNVIPAVVALDETLRLLDAVSSEVPQDAFQRRMIGAALDTHMDMQRAYLAQRRPSPPPPQPDLAPLREAGIPLEPGLAARQAEDADRRRGLAGALLARDGWGWDDVYGHAAGPTAVHR